MEINTLINMLTSMDIASDDWVTSDRIHTINLTTDGNHYNNYYEQRLYFDTTAGVIKIKYYNFILVSSKFLNVTEVDTTHFTMKPNDYAYYGKDEIETLAKFRNPKAGDIAYTIDSAGTVVAATITGITASSITVDTALSLTGKTLCYANGGLLEISGGIIVGKRDLSTVEDILDNPAHILYRQPKTIYTADEYLFLDNVNGMSLNRY